MTIVQNMQYYLGKFYWSWMIVLGCLFHPTASLGQTRTPAGPCDIMTAREVSTVYHWRGYCSDGLAHGEGILLGFRKGAPLPHVAMAGSMSNGVIDIRERYISQDVVDPVTQRKLPPLIMRFQRNRDGQAVQPSELPEWASALVDRSQASQGRGDAQQLGKAQPSPSPTGRQPEGFSWDSILIGTGGKIQNAPSLPGKVEVIGSSPIPAESYQKLCARAAAKGINRNILGAIYRVEVFPSVDGSSVYGSMGPQVKLTPLKLHAIFQDGSTAYSKAYLHKDEFGEQKCVPAN